MTLTISPVYEGRMLRSYLKHTLGLSAAVLARLKTHQQGIVVNGQRVTVRYILHAGDVLTLADGDTHETATETVIPTELPLEILYEDDFIAVLNKPAGMPTHPSHGHLTDTLANALAFRYAQRREPFVFRPLGRLDRNTSGVVVTGKTRAASGCLSRSLRNGEVIKRYIAILDGVMPVLPETQKIETYVYRPDGAGIQRAVCAPDTPEAEYALTAYRVLAVSDTHTLVLAEPKTGRTHQLRVHFAHLGYPILGDEIYGQTSSMIGRHALHALSLSVPMPFADAVGAVDPSFSNAVNTPLNHPSADGYLHTLAPFPEDMTVALTALLPHAHIPTCLTSATACVTDLAQLSLT